MSQQKVAVVTGANKGIGFGIVTGLCEKYDGIVYLTSRDCERGEEAIRKLKEKNLVAHYHQLDITDEDSIIKFKNYLVDKHGGIDLLVNNAGIAFKVKDTAPFHQQAKVTVDVNYFGTLRVSEILFPILRKDARVINLSSSCGHLSKIPSTQLKARFNDKNLTITQLNELMKEFIESAKDGSSAEKGWGTSTYNVSKVGVSALTFVQQRLVDSEPNKKNIQVNCVHPGYVVTDMTSGTGQLTVEEGSKAALFLCLEPHNFYGKYVWRDCTVPKWDAPNTPAPF